MWKLKDKNGKFRSRKSFKQDCAMDSDEPWEVARKKKKSIMGGKLKRMTKY